MHFFAVYFIKPIIWDRGQDGVLNLTRGQTSNCVIFCSATVGLFSLGVGVMEDRINKSMVGVMHSLNNYAVIHVFYVDACQRLLPQSGTYVLQLCMLVSNKLLKNTLKLSHNLPRTVLVIPFIYRLLYLSSMNTFFYGIIYVVGTCWATVVV
jgi:hypothetical protein